MIDPSLDDVTRIEVIDADGRSYMSHDASRVDTALQDGGRTLKVFHNGKPLIVPSWKHLLVLELIETTCRGMVEGEGLAVNTSYTRGIEDMASTILRILDTHLKEDDKPIAANPPE